jgi:hypothetical protein
MDPMRTYGVIFGREVVVEAARLFDDGAPVAGSCATAAGS